MGYMEDELEWIYSIDVVTEGDDWIARDDEGRVLRRSALVRALALLRIHYCEVNRQCDELRNERDELKKDRDQWVNAYQDAYIDNKELFEENGERNLLQKNLDEMRLSNELGRVTSEYLRNENARLSSQVRELMYEKIELMREKAQLVLEITDDSSFCDDEEDYV